jgi:hypothetical protein
VKPLDDEPKAARAALAATRSRTPSHREAADAAWTIAVQVPWVALRCTHGYSRLAADAALFAAVPFVRMRGTDTCVHQCNNRNAPEFSDQRERSISSERQLDAKHAAK